MLDFFPRSIEIKARTRFRSMTAYARGLHISDAAVAFARLGNVSGSRSVTRFALNIRKPRTRDAVCGISRSSARGMTIETTCIDLVPLRDRLFARVAVTAVCPLYVLRKMTLATSNTRRERLAADRD